jgi:hypothetical protein
MVHVAAFPLAPDEMDISFSERLNNIMTLQHLLSLQGPNGLLEAKQLEHSAYEKANSKVQRQH